MWIQAPLVFRARDFVSLSLWWVLAVGVLDMESKPFGLQGEARSWDFSPDCKALCCGWSWCQECGKNSLSYLFWCAYFLICPTCRSCSASFWVPFRVNCSICSCTFGVSVWGGELLRHHLVDSQFLKFCILLFSQNISLCSNTVFWNLKYFL